MANNKMLSKIKVGDKIVIYVANLKYLGIYKGIKDDKLILQFKSGSRYEFQLENIQKIEKVIGE